MPNVILCIEAKCFAVMSNVRKQSKTAAYGLLNNVQYMYTFVVCALRILLLFRINVVFFRKIF